MPAARTADDLAEPSTESPAAAENAGAAAPNSRYLICSRRAVVLGGVGAVGTLLVSACTAHGTSAAGAANDGTSAATADSAAGLPATAGSAAGTPDVSALNSRTPGSSALTPSTSAGPAATGAGQPAPTRSGPTSAQPVQTPAAPTKSAGPTTPAPTPAPTHAATPTPSAQPSSSPSSSASKKPAGTVLAALSAVPAGGSLVVNGPNGPVAIARPSSSSVVAHTAICTHMGCTVGAAGAMLACPCHGSQYNAFTGAVVQGPAPAALRAISVHVDGSQIVTP
ncbi:MAG: Rieske (2Fe-2S) protein [Acidothermaceae bacterium]